MVRLAAFLALATALAVGPVHAQTAAPAPARPAPAAAARPAAPPAAKPAPVQPAAVAVRKVDVNAAPEAQLGTLPGIGPVRAKAIVTNRPYDTLDALADRKALPPAVLAKVRDQLALADINGSSARDLQRTLPGIGDVRAGQIVAGRPYAAPGDLVTRGILTQAQFDRVKDLVAY